MAKAPMSASAACSSKVARSSRFAIWQWLADGWDNLRGPTGQRLGGRGIVRAPVDEAARVVLEHGGGELVDPLPGGAADPAAVLAPGGGEQLGVMRPPKL